jgi:regulator of sigma E protease
MPFVYFIVLIGVLVFVHEIGHFVCAKFFGVKVLRFSLGFGPRIAGFRRGETEYVIAAVPLGGYVRLLGENRLDEVRPEEEHRSLENQSIWKRIVIFVAGPLMNVLFPVLLYFVVFLGDTSLTPAVVGMVVPGQPAEGKLLPGDRILEVDGQAVESFYGLQRMVEDRAGEPLEFVVQRGQERVKQTVTPVRSLQQYPLGITDEVGRIGISPYHPRPVVGVISATGPAGAALLRTFDLVVAARGEPVDKWSDLERMLDRNQGSLLPLTYLRPVTIRGALGGLLDLDVYEPRVTTLTPEPGPGAGSERAGLELADLYVSQVKENSPEHRMGLLPGDRLLSLDGERIGFWRSLVLRLTEQSDTTHRLTWRRGQRVMSGSFSLKQEKGVGELGQITDRFVVGIRNWVPLRLEPPTNNPHPITYALQEAVSETASMVRFTVYSIIRLLQGRLTVKSIGGPLAIFEVSGTAAREGVLNYLKLMAFISINLGLINLLPIPLLDGGHLVFALIEAVMRRPLSLRVREKAYIIGLVLLLLLMILAVKNDVERRYFRDDTHSSQR